MATLTWDAVGGDPTPGDPAVFEAMARGFGHTAEDAADAKRKLESFSRGVDDSIWRGESADAFRDKIDELPGRLGKLHSSYTAAADGVAGYGRALRDLQGQARSLLSQAQDAHADQAREKRSRDQARDADPTAPTMHHDDAIAAAQGRLNGARNRIDDLRDRRRSAEDRAIAKLDEAGELGIANDSWWKRTFDAIDNWVDEHADILKTLSEALKVISAIAGVLSFIPFLAPICGPIALIAGGLALLTDAALAATGNGSWKSLMVDAALMALPGAGRLLRAGSKLAKARVVRAARPPGGFSATTLRGKAVQFGKRVICGDPIDVATGEMVMSENDVDLPGILPLVLTRTHVSSYREGRWFGPSWASTLDQRVEVDEEGICYVGADGVVLAYPTPDRDDPVLPAEGPRWPLTRAEDGRFRVVDEDRGQTLEFGPVDDSGLLPLAAVVDRNGHRLDLAYGGDGNLQEVAHSGGYRIRVETSDGLVTALHLRDADEGRDVQLVGYQYDGARHLTGVVNSSGTPLRLHYDPDGRVTRWEDRNGSWYRYTYDGEGRCVRAEGAGGCLDGTFAYDRESRTTTWTNSLGHPTVFSLNDLNQVVKETDPLGHTTMSERDRYDRLLAHTDPLGNTTRYDYDNGNLIRVTAPDGTRTEATYNRFRQPVTVVEPHGATWRRGYDERGNLTAVTDPLGATTTYAYDERGHLVTATDALGHVTRVDTDGAGLPVAVIDALGATTRYTRDGFGRVIAVTDPLDGVTRFGWTVEGKLARRVQPDGTTERWVLDGEGNVVEHVDAAGHITRTEVGRFDLPAASVGPDGARVEFAYDTELRLVSVTNPHGLVWRYDYDPAGNLEWETDFDGRVLRYVHDGAGRMVERTDAAGRTTRFLRDRLGRVVEQRSGDAIATFDHDPAGRLVRATNAAAEVELERDGLGRIVAETCNGRTVRSTFDAVGRRLSRVTPSGAESRWDYDATGQPRALHAAGATLHFGYDAMGQEVERRLGRATLALTWDANHQLATQTVTSGRAARLVQHRSYRYRADGFVTDIDDHLGGNRALDLDPIGRVTALHGAGWSERYAYDHSGNVTAADWPAPAPPGTPADDSRGPREYDGSLLRRAGDVWYEYDADDRLVVRQHRRPTGDSPTWRYTWDHDDRLAEVTTPDEATWRYRYDALGRRIVKQRLGADGRSVAEQVDFTWDGTVLAEQADAGSGRTSIWDWEPSGFRPVSQVDRTRLADAPQEWVDERFYAIVTDLAGAPAEMVDADGNLAWRLRTNLWGAAAQPPDSSACPLRFPGQYFDAETGLHYNFFRYYDPATSRYATSDPLGIAPSTNPFAYVSNPLAWIDPLGLMRCATSRAARREAMRQHGIPTSQQPISQMRSAAGHQYEYDVAGTRKAVTDQTTDRVADHGPHWEAGTAKTPAEYGRDPLGRLRVRNEGKTKVDYGPDPGGGG